MIPFAASGSDLHEFGGCIQWNSHNGEPEGVRRMGDECRISRSKECVLLAKSLSELAHDSAQIQMSMQINKFRGIEDLI
jgi:hypothetical protein